MILLCVTAGNRMPADRLLGALAGSSWFWRILPVTYERLLAEGPPCLGGTWLFADIESLDADRRDRLAGLRMRLSDSHPPGLVLNDPHSTLRRFELLSRLHADGTNQFRLFRASEPLPADLRYPVFLRGENDHHGSRTPLLHDRGELALAMQEHLTDGGKGWVVTEFADARGADGLVRKYSAFCVGDLVVPRHLFFSREWMLKEADVIDAACDREEWAYLNDNPHADELRRIFNLAGVAYGRIDYGWVGGRVQVWEINTNPVVLRINHTWNGPRAAQHRLFRERLLGAFERIDRPVTRFPRRNKLADLANQFRRSYADIVLPAIRPALRAAAGVKRRLRA